MLITKFVTEDDELIQIEQLSRSNSIANLLDEIKKKEGFVTWSYSIDDLRILHTIAPSVIAKDGDKVVGYALVLVREAADNYAPFSQTLEMVKPLIYQEKPILDYRVYFMGQICVAQDYRGQGVVNLLYQFHKEHLSPGYDMLLTEISVNNPRSQKAHEKVGFKTIHTHKDEKEEWNTVLWDWRS